MDIPYSNWRFCGLWRILSLCSGLGLGCCAIAAFQHEICNELFGLDGEEEFVVYAVPVGTISEKDKTSEKAFYQFVEDEGL